MALLDVRKLTVRFGGLTAVNKVDLEVPAGQIFSIIGPNGAGKTTLFNAVTGIHEPTEGEISFEGRDLRKPFTPRVAALIGLVAFMSGVFAVIVRHLEAIWTLTIWDNYTFLQPFPWSKALTDLIGYLAANRGDILASFLVGLGVGAAGAAVVWLQQRRTPNSIARRGICRTFQNIRLFQNMTVLENVMIGLDYHLKSRLWDAALRTGRFRREQREATARSLELLKLVGLDKRANSLAKNLPYGDQRRLEIARALATQPRLLLLDEPAAGMHPTETNDLMELIGRLRAGGITIALIEHHMKVVMGVSDTVAVLDYGVKIAEGSPAAVRANPKVIEAYLGKDENS